MYAYLYVCMCTHTTHTTHTRTHTHTTHMRTHVRAHAHAHTHSYSCVILFSWWQSVGCSSSQNLLSLRTPCSSSCARRTIRLHSFMFTITHQWLFSGGFGLNGYLVGLVSFLCHLSICLSICKYVHAYTRMYVCMYICIYVSIHTVCTYILIPGTCVWLYYYDYVCISYSCYWLLRR